MTPEWIVPPPGAEAPVTVAEWADAAAQLGEDIIRKHGSMRFGVLMMVDATGRVGEAMVDTPANDDEADRMANELARVMLVEGVVMYAFVMEGWWRLLGGKQWDGVLPSQSPDRVEVLMVTAQSLADDSVGLALPMRRDRAGKFMGLGENMLKVGMTASGRFATLLRRPH